MSDTPLAKPLEDTGTELETWLRTESQQRLQAANSRRVYASAERDATTEDLRIAHAIAEGMAGRSLRRTTRAEAKRSADIQDRIAAKLEREAAMLIRFADYVASSPHLMETNNSILQEKRDGSNN